MCSSDDSDEDLFTHPYGMKAKLTRAARRAQLDEHAGEERRRELADQDEFFHSICHWSGEATPTVVFRRDGGTIFWAGRKLETRLKYI